MSNQCAACGERAREGLKYCSRECAPYGYFRSGKRQKGPIQYFSRARLEIERLTAENAKLRARLEGREYQPPALPARIDAVISKKGERVWLATRPRFHRQKKDTRTLEERALELLRELYGPGYKPPK
jgi:hypothetical protein